MHNGLISFHFIIFRGCTKKKPSSTQFALGVHSSCWLVATYKQEKFPVWCLKQAETPFSRTYSHAEAPHEAAGHPGHAFLCLLVEDTAFMERGGQGTNIHRIKEEEDWAMNQKKAFSSAEKMRGCLSRGECVSAPQQPCCHPFASAADRKGMVLPGSYCAGEEFGPKSRQKSTRRWLSRG